MKKFKILVLVSLLFLNTSCINSLIRSSVKDSTIGNKMPLHSNPRVGDFAVLKGSDGNAQMTLKIVSKKGAYFVIRTNTGVTFPGAGYINNLTIEMYVNKRGNIKRAYLIDGKDRTMLKIAKKGENEYMKPVRLTRSEKNNMNIPNRLTVPAGTFRVSSNAYKTINNERDQRIVYLTNRNVKFMQVASYSYSVNDNGDYDKYQGFELVSQGNRR